jgi:hypothetical protein
LARVDLLAVGSGPCLTALAGMHPAVNFELSVDVTESQLVLALYGQLDAAGASQVVTEKVP